MEPIEVHEGSSSGEGPVQPNLEPTPSPVGGSTLKIPPAGIQERLGFLLGVQPSSSSSRGTQGGGLPPVAAPARGRKRGRTHMACYAMLHAIEPSSYECNEKVDVVVATLHKLIKEYEVEEDDYQSVRDSLSSAPAPAIMSFFHDIVAQQGPAAARVQGEIEHLLADDLVPYTEKFDILDWWKVAGITYPTLRKLARDVYAIPVTTDRFGICI